MTVEQIFAQLWASLAAAVREHNHPFNVMQVATTGVDGAPNVRTVLLRGVSERDNRLTFHTDLRSPKIAELSREPRIALVCVDTARNLQIRVAGESRIVRDAQVRRAAWQGSPDHDLLAYRTHVAPGTPLRDADDALNPRDVRDAQAGFAHFCVVDVHPLRLEWLDLSVADRPLRTRHLLERGTWVHCWIAP